MADYLYFRISFLFPNDFFITPYIIEILYLRLIVKVEYISILHTLNLEQSKKIYNSIWLGNIVSTLAGIPVSYFYIYNSHSLEVQLSGLFFTNIIYFRIH